MPSPIARSRIAAPGTWLKRRHAGRNRRGNPPRRAVPPLSATQRRPCRRLRSMANTIALAAASASCRPAMIDVVHRLVTDTGRLTEKWLQRHRLADGISEEEYVEIIGVVATLGRTRYAAPGDRRRAGRRCRFRKQATPSRIRAPWRPQGPRLGGDAVARNHRGLGDPPIFARHGSVNIHRALSLVPQEAINFFDLDVELYLKDDEDPRLRQRVPRDQPRADRIDRRANIVSQRLLLLNDVTCPTAPCER